MPSCVVRPRRHDEFVFVARVKVQRAVDEIVRGGFGADVKVGETNGRRAEWCRWAESSVRVWQPLSLA